MDVSKFMLFSYLDSLPSEIVSIFLNIGITLVITGLGVLQLTLLDDRIWELNRLKLLQVRRVIIASLFWTTSITFTTIFKGDQFYIFNTTTNVSILLFVYLIYEANLTSQVAIKVNRFFFVAVLIIFTFLSVIWFRETDDRWFRALVVHSCLAYFFLSSSVLGIYNWSTQNKIERSFTGIWIFTTAIFITYLVNATTTTPIPYVATIALLSNIVLIIGFLFTSISSMTMHLINRITDLSETDQLTKLHNRHYFFENVYNLLALSSRKNLNSAIAIFDIDDFKLINDTYGHQVGDHVLEKFSDLMKDSFRSHTMKIRWGGEEFLAFFPMTDIEEAQVAVERFLEALRKLKIGTNVETITISASVGLALCKSSEELDTSINFADQALYNAKENGKDQVQFKA